MLFPIVWFVPFGSSRLVRPFVWYVIAPFCGECTRKEATHLPPNRVGVVQSTCDWLPHPWRNMRARGWCLQVVGKTNPRGRAWLVWTEPLEDVVNGIPIHVAHPDALRTRSSRDRGRFAVKLFCLCFQVACASALCGGGGGVSFPLIYHLRVTAEAPIPSRIAHHPRTRIDTSRLKLQHFF